MDLPAPLKAAIEAELAGTPLADLRRAAAVLSRRYRDETRDGRLHLSDDLFAKAYAAARMPATFAAVAAAMSETAARVPEWQPASLLDVGSGPGTALWAAHEIWPMLAEAELMEASAPIRALAARLGYRAFPFQPRLTAADVSRSGVSGAKPADLVTLAYVLDELSAAEGERLVGDLFALTRGVLLIVEPGTTAGWRRILAARDALTRAGAQILAPCPHALECPIAAPDWCHFAQRLARSRIHRMAKEGDAPFEDEKFIYFAAARFAATHGAEARVLARPQTASGRVALKLCRADGALEPRLLTRRDGAAFKQARRLDWGDAV